MHVDKQCINVRSSFASLLQALLFCFLFFHHPCQRVSSASQHRAELYVGCFSTLITNYQINIAIKPYSLVLFCKLMRMCAWKCLILWVNANASSFYVVMPYQYLCLIRPSNTSGRRFCRHETFQIFFSRFVFAEKYILTAFIPILGLCLLLYPYKHFPCVFMSYLKSSMYVCLSLSKVSISIYNCLLDVVHA